MAEPYLKAGKAILHTTAELFPGGQSLMCVLFPVRRPGSLRVERVVSNGMFEVRSQKAV